MQKRGLTFEDLARLSGVPYSTLTKIGSGVTENPGFCAMEKIAEVLDCSLDEFAERQPLISYEDIEYLYRYQKLPGNIKEYIKHIINMEYSQIMHHDSGETIKKENF